MDRAKPLEIVSNTVRYEVLITLVVILALLLPVLINQLSVQTDLNASRLSNIITGVKSLSENPDVSLIDLQISGRRIVIHYSDYRNSGITFNSDSILPEERSIIGSRLMNPVENQLFFSRFDAVNFGAANYQVFVSFNGQVETYQSLGTSIDLRIANMRVGQSNDERNVAQLDFYLIVPEHNGDTASVTVSALYIDDGINTGYVSFENRYEIPDNLRLMIEDLMRNNAFLNNQDVRDVLALADLVGDNTDTEHTIDAETPGVES